MQRRTNTTIDEPQREADAGASLTAGLVVNTSYRNPWEAVLALIRLRMDDEDFRRWFGTTVYASDSGDQISVWVPTEAIRRHVVIQLHHHIDAALAALDRKDTTVRFIVTGVGEDEEDDEVDD